VSNYAWHGLPAREDYRSTGLKPVRPRPGWPCHKKISAGDAAPDLEISAGFASRNPPGPRPRGGPDSDGYFKIGVGLSKIDERTIIRMQQEY